ncbi:MAG TPA: alcohol dehydrogenase [Actinobacteria bacterium]|nr:alcohol dehydrogenase [Actinomycetota bacterium]
MGGQLAVTLTFEFATAGRIIAGAGRTAELPQLLAGLGSRLLVCTGADTSRHAGLLAGLGLPAAVVTVAGEPTVELARTAAAAAREHAADVVVAIGGGSVIDTGKAVAMLLANGGDPLDYLEVIGRGQPLGHASAPFIAIPTTAGTGSECQSFALIADETTHQKMACGDPKAAARIAILDPLLTLSQPPRVAACTGIDALSHALETAVTRPRNPISLAYSRQAFRLCWSHFPRMLKRPDDLEARAGMLLGAALAGLAIENSMLGAAHAAANPLSAHFNIVHGQAIGLMLPHVLRFNGRNPAAARLYASLDSSNADHLAEKLESLLDLAGLPRSLSQCGVTHSSIPVLAREAARQWTAAFNPRPVAAADFARLFEAAWENTK